MNLPKAVRFVKDKGMLLVFPQENRKEPPSLWYEFFPRTKMRWEWDESGDNRVGELWMLRERLSLSRKVIYTKWFRGRATLMSLDVFCAVVRKTNPDLPEVHGLSFSAREVLDLLQEDSPLSTKQLKKLTGMQGRASETAYQRALKELWNRGLIVAYGEVDEGAFPSLAVGATQVIFEECWSKACAMTEADADKILATLPEGSLFTKFLNTVLKNLKTAAVGIAMLSLLTGVVPIPRAPLHAELARFSDGGSEAFAALIGEGKPYHSSDGQQFDKLSVIFNMPAKVGKISVESCEGDFKDGAEFFFFPGWRRVFAEGGKTVLQAKAGEEMIKSVAVSFRHNTKFCLKSFKLLSVEGNELKLELPARVPAANQDDRTVVAKMKQAFEQAQVTGALDAELRVDDEDPWVFRFRSNGTFYIQGFGDDIKAAHGFSVLGTFEVIKTSDKKIRIILNGEKYMTPGVWDGAICSGFCKGELAGLPVHDELVIEKWKGETFMVRDRSEGVKRALPFADLRAKKTSLSD